MMNNIFELMIRRSHQATPVPPVVGWNSYFPKQAFEGRTVANTRFVIERGNLIACNLSNSTSGTYKGRVGTSNQWTCVTESYGNNYAYGICDGTVYYLDYANMTATSLNMSATYVAGNSYTHATDGNVYGLACNSNGLYRLDGTTATLINAKGDWTQIGGGVGDPSTSNDISPFGLDSTGTVYKIAYDGTLTQVATGMTAISAGYNNYTSWTAGYYGEVDEITFYQSASGVSTPAYYIYDGALYRLTQTRNVQHDPAITGGTTGTLVDDTGTWTSVWVKGNSGYGIRDNSLYQISGSTITDMQIATRAWKAGYNSFIGLDDGCIYWVKNTGSGAWQRLTDIDYDSSSSSSEPTDPLTLNDETMSCTDGMSDTIYLVASGGTGNYTFSTSDTLPTGFTFGSDGSVSYDGTMCGTQTEQISVTCDDGVDTVTATLTIDIQHNNVTISDQYVTFYNNGDSSQTWQLYLDSGDAALCTWTYADLPSGVMDSGTDTIEYDGVSSTADTYTATVEVDDGYSSGTATIEVTIEDIPVVPTDYHERWALQSDRNSTKHPSDTTYTLERSTNASVSYGASGGMTGATVSSGCLYNTNSISGSVTNGYCLSIWCKCSTTPTSSTNIKCFANPANSTQYGLWLGYRQNKYAVGCDMTTSSLRAVSDVSVDTSWHNLVANYDKTNLKVDLWIDGVKAATFSLSSAISKAAGIVVNAGNVTDVTAPDYMPDVSVKYAYVTTFTRTLSDAEVLGLYHEFD